MKAWLYLCLIVPAFGAIDGTVRNVTTGKPQPGATVTLYKLGQAGMESIESVKSDPQGKFRIEQDLQGPRLIQTAYDGVTYNHMLPPGAATSGIQLEVYNSSKQPHEAKVTQHIVLLEPSGGELAVSENYLFRNPGKITYNDPEGGTLKIFAPASAKNLEVNATAPQGMPIRRAADKTAETNIYKIDFPIKPGETRIDVNYVMPLRTGGFYEGKDLFKGGPTRLVAPAGVTLSGSGIQFLSKEPRTQASIYNVKGASYRVKIEGQGTLRAAGESASDSEDSGPGLQQIMPRVYDHLKWIVALAAAILALGFALLYRAQAQPAASAAPKAGKSKNERGRR